MKSDSKSWVVLGEPATPAEAEALDRLRELLPDDGITTAWVNLTSINHNGRTDEIDVLLLTRTGLFVLELKGWHGSIQLEGPNWRRTANKVTVVKNPYILTDSKAKRLGSLLGEVAGGIPGKLKSPFVGSFVVLHGTDSTVAVDASGGTYLLALDGYGVKGLGEDQLFSRFVARTPDPEHPERAIDAVRAKQIRKIIESAGFLPTPKTRTVGHYLIDDADPLGEGTHWRDVLVTHPDTQRKRRVRLFDVPRGASASARQEIETLAKREFRFTDGLSFPGIARALEYFATDHGPALLFDWHPDEQPLDDFLAGEGAGLDLDARIGLVRKVGEVLAYAHARRLMHRALTPRQIFVRRSGDSLSVSIRDWFTARRTSDDTSSLTMVSRGVSEVDQLVQSESWIYLAPETLRHVSEPPPIALDVYGLGAVAFLILTGLPPAQSIKELDERLQSEPGGCLDPLAVSPDLPEPLAAVVMGATSFHELHRTVDVESVLAGLEAALDELTRPEDDRPREAEGDPLDASAGETIGERFIVRDRRGAGSTGTALLVDDIEPLREGVILKLARDDAARARLQSEAEVLAGLSHPRLVKLIEGPLVVAGRSALILSDAGPVTLAQRLRNEGRATIEQLERFGGDLLEAVAYLDSVGVFHRDIKPANLAVAPDPGTRRPRLNLFDFSLASEPVRNLESGSRPYLDPFLGPPKRRQYDRAAELYAVAVTLFELATAVTPWWSSGDSSPTGPDDAVVLQAGMFDPALAPGLIDFFGRALHPDAAQRFANISEFAQHWQRLFEAIDEPREQAQDAPSNDELAERAEADTSLELSGLSARALSALARLGVSTVGELLATPPLRINAIPGMGEHVRKEVQRRVSQWRERLSAAPVATPEPDGRVSVERRTDALARRSPSMSEQDEAVLRRLAGVDFDESAAQAWPTIGELSTLTGVPYAGVTGAIEAATTRWRKNGTLVQVSEELRGLLAARGRVATVQELAAALLMAFGSARDGAERHARALGLLRAAVELDAAAASPRLALHREGERVLVALEGEAGAPDAAALFAAALALGRSADELVADGEVIGATAAREQLRAAVPAGRVFDDQRLVELAVSVSAGAARSSVGELYPRGLSGARAVEATLRGIAARDLSRDGIVRRTEARFALAEPVPHRPELDEVVARTHPHLRWSGDAYRPRETTQGSATSITGTVHGSLPAAETLDRLSASLRSSSALTIAVHPRRFAQAKRLLSARFGVTEVDLSAELVLRMREAAATRGASWPVVTRADAAERDSRDFRNLLLLARTAFEPFWQELSARPEPLLLTHAAVLPRYGFAAELAELFDLSRPRPAARWLLVPHSPSTPAPELDGHPIPFGPDRWLTLPDLSAVPLDPQGVPA